MLAESRTATASAVIDEDTLVQIFFLLSRDADITRKEGKVWDWVSVTEVCRYWHAVATRTPRLWSYLDSYTFRSADRTQKFIQLSKNADLTVIYNDEGAAGDYSGDNLKTSLKELRRIAHLKLSVNSGVGHPHKLLLFGLLASDYPAPCMQSIEIAICSHLTLPSVRLPSTSQGILRKVSLAYLNLSTVAPSLTHLQSLALNSCEISFSELHGILKACPMLENLKLKFCRIDCANTSTLEQVHAERLTNFKLLARHPSELVEISEKLEAPNASRAIIWCDIYLEGGILSPRG